MTTGLLRKIALGALVAVVFLPISVLVAATIQYALFPGCYGHMTPHTSGEHLGFRIGMSRVEAAAVVGSQHAKQLKNGEVVVTPGYSRPTTAGELAAISPVSNWYIRRGGSLCLMSNRRTVLHFGSDRVVRIDDALSYAGI